LVFPAILSNTSSPGVYFGTDIAGPAIATAINASGSLVGIQIS
jgi:hypothetical protein